MKSDGYNSSYTLATPNRVITNLSWFDTVKFVLMDHTCGNKSCGKVKPAAHCYASCMQNQLVLHCTVCRIFPVAVSAEWKGNPRACMCVPVIAIHLPLCADMGCFSAVTQCSFYPVPLAVSPLSLSLSSSFSLVTQLPAQSDVSNLLLSNTLALLGEAELLSPPPASSRLMFTPFSSAPSLPYTFIILFATVTLYISSVRLRISPFTSPFFLLCLSLIWLARPRWFICVIFLILCLLSCKTGLTWKQG